MGERWWKARLGSGSSPTLCANTRACCWLLCPEPRRRERPTSIGAIEDQHTVEMIGLVLDYHGHEACHFPLSGDAIPVEVPSTNPVGAHDLFRRVRDGEASLFARHR